jgi:hypothetical protein
MDFSRNKPIKSKMCFLAGQYLRNKFEFFAQFFKKKEITLFLYEENA